MKRIIVFGLVAFSTLAAYAQLPKWLIPPTNDTIFVKVDSHLLQTIEGKTSSLWTMDGKKVFSTENHILPFKDDVATILNRDKTAIVGFVDREGKFIALPNVAIAYDNPYFEDGYITAIEKNRIVFYKKDGGKAELPYAQKAYPFHRGFAPNLTYINTEKKKDPYYTYYKIDGSVPKFFILQKGQAKPLESQNIDFLSGIGTNGKGIGVIKDKLYWYDPKTSTFEPFLWGNASSEKKRHLNLEGDYQQYFLNLPDSPEIQAKYGKNQIARLLFDKELLPKSFIFEDKTMTFSETPEKPFEYTSNLTEYGKKSFGLSFDNKKILPEQFQSVGTKYDENAFVKLNDKWGLIEILPDINYTLKINKGEDIAFRHQKFETQIRLDLPPMISAKDARLDISESTGCILDKTSRETKDTESGNFITYNCTLNIPESLPDTITAITYSPVKITYDGLRLFDIPITVKAWHLKYYNVDPIESETSISNGTATFTLNINAQRNVGEGDFPFEVRIEADSINVDYEKLSETRYKCMVNNLQEGNNNLNIIVTEKGCPPSIFPFEVFYIKPVSKTKKKEEVVIRKKNPIIKKHTPRLEI